MTKAYLLTVSILMMFFITACQSGLHITQGTDTSVSTSTETNTTTITKDPDLKLCYEKLGASKQLNGSLVVKVNMLSQKVDNLTFMVDQLLKEGMVHDKRLKQSNKN